MFVAEQYPAWDVTAVDSSAVGLQKAASLAASRNVNITTQVADLADYEYGTAAWDVVIGISCHLPPPIRMRLLQALPKALKPRGYVVMENYTPKQAFSRRFSNIPRRRLTSSIIF